MNRINAFMVEWFDPQAQEVKNFRLNFFPDNTIELLDIVKGKMVLKRIHYPKVTPDMLFIGSTVNVFGKQLDLVDYADAGTRAYMEEARTYGFAVLWPGAGVRALGAVLARAAAAGFAPAALRSADLGAAAVAAAEGALRRPLPALAAAAAGAAAGGGGGEGPAVLLKVAGGAGEEAAWAGALAAAAREVGADPAEAFYASAGSGDAREEADYFLGDAALFPHAPPGPADDVTLCLIKPHVVKGGAAGAVVGAVLAAGFPLTAAQLVRLDPRAAQEFFGAYQEALPEYRAALDHLSEGPSLALRLGAPPLAAGGEEGAVAALRELCGPADVEIAQVLRPTSLRAQFGQDNAHNAVHCTDMPEDGLLECQYIFETLGSI